MIKAAQEEPARSPNDTDQSLTTACPVPFNNKYLAVARDTHGSTDGHAVQRHHAPTGHSARIEEES